MINLLTRQKRCFLLHSLPFPDGVPSLYPGKLDTEDAADAAAGWVTAQKKTHALPTVTDAVLENVVQAKDSP